MYNVGDGDDDDDYYYYIYYYIYIQTSLKKKKHHKSVSNERVKWSSPIKMEALPPLESEETMGLYSGFITCKGDEGDKPS